MRGIRNLRRPTPKYPILWDVNVLLTYLSNWRVESLKDITLKLATLLAVLSVQRVHSLTLIDYRCISFMANGTFISIFDDLKIARSRPSFVIALPGSSDPDPLAIVSLLKSYLSQTASLRPQTCLQLFVSYCKPHKGVSSDTVSRWIKSVLQLAGIDISHFGSHSVRGAAASAALHANAPLDSVLTAGDWSTTQSFSRHYHRRSGNLPSPAVANALMQTFSQ